MHMISKNHESLLNHLQNQGKLNASEMLHIRSEIKFGTNVLALIQESYGIDGWDISQLLANAEGVRWKRWDISDLDARIINTIPLDALQRLSCLPIQRNGNTLVILISTSDSLELRSLLRRYFPDIHDHHLYLVPEAFLDKCFGQIPRSSDILINHLDQLHQWAQGVETDDERVTDQILGFILQDGFGRRASDIHFEPGSNHVQIRFRIDVIMQPFVQFSLRHWRYLTARIKVLGEMNTAESRRPQMGRFTQDILGHTVDIRISSHPTIHGESIVLRLLDQHKMVKPLDQLGFCQRSLDLLKQIYTSPQGLVLFTGPTGSGKTTTLYSILNQLNTGDRNIMTLEDPVEYDLSGIRQTAIQGDVLRFSDGIRSVLRQDPDVILIGEIRDEESAKMAFRASQTGHLVFSTLHTNDVWGIFPRLMDLGITFESIRHTVVGMVSQRLVRKRCSCTTHGCSHCNHTGYHGRLAIGEMLWVTPQVRQHLTPDNSMLSQDILSEHYISLQDAGHIAVQHQWTTDDELKRYI